MNMKVTIIPGDGIGPEIMQVNKKILTKLYPAFEFEEVMIGEQALAKSGELLPQSALDIIAKNKIAIKSPLNTPIGEGFKSINVTLRQKFNLFANIRPSHSFPNVPSRFSQVDLVLFRENVEGMYSGEGQMISLDGQRAEARSVVTVKGSTNILKAAFDYAAQNHKTKVTVVHKANILKSTSGLFLKTAREVAKLYPTIQMEEMIVDNCAMQLVIRPERFQVIVTTNLFGDILSDLCAGLVGGLGVAPGANVGPEIFIAEAVHGTAPDIAGKNLANPTALILASNLLLKHLGLNAQSAQLESALNQAFAHKQITKDLGGNLGTKEFGDYLLSLLS
jgi:isocitrate dehydrogenase (NAD+)